MDRRKFIAGAAATAALFSGCSPSAPDKIEGKLSVAALNLAASARLKFGTACYVLLSDSNYRTVDTSWLGSSFYTQFKNELFTKGIVKWDAKFDCDKFAQYFTSLLQVTYFIQNFQSWSVSESLAVGELYYKIGGDATKGHAINLVYINGDFQFFEPQIGQFVTLTPVEIASVYFVKF